jgi:hypothetical protein
MYFELSEKKIEKFATHSRKFRQMELGGQVLGAANVLSATGERTPAGKEFCRKFFRDGTLVTR